MDKMTKKYHVWIENPETKHVSNIMVIEDPTDIIIDMGIYKQGLLTITYEEEI